jgi:hypothetical protein
MQRCPMPYSLHVRDAPKSRIREQSGFFTRLALSIERRPIQGLDISRQPRVYIDDPFSFGSALTF